MSTLLHTLDPAVMVTIDDIVLAVLLGAVVVLLVIMARDLKNRFTDQ